MEQVNVIIFTGFTELTLDSVEVVILEFSQGLWFRKRMEKLIINKNQCQKFGIQICDYVTDSHRKLVTEAYGGIFIPMKTEGYTCVIIINTHTENGIHELQHILLSDEFYWDPSNKLFEIS